VEPQVAGLGRAAADEVKPLHDLSDAHVRASGIARLKALESVKTVYLHVERRSLLLEPDGELNRTGSWR
jgi:hypothetical protein